MDSWLVHPQETFCQRATEPSGCGHAEATGDSKRRGHSGARNFWCNVSDDVLHAEPDSALAEASCKHREGHQVPRAGARNNIGNGNEYLNEGADANYRTAAKSAQRDSPKWHRKANCYAWQSHQQNASEGLGKMQVFQEVE